MGGGVVVVGIVSLTPVVGSWSLWVINVGGRVVMVVLSKLVVGGGGGGGGLSSGKTNNAIDHYLSLYIAIGHYLCNKCNNCIMASIPYPPHL